MKSKYTPILFVLTLLLVGCFGNSPKLEYDGVDYSFHSSIPMVFGVDTINTELWYRDVNIENDYIRVIKCYTATDTIVFPLPNANWNHTSSAWYSLLVDDKKYLWYEDNFGTTVFDIDSNELKTVLLPEKELSTTLSNGAPIGTYKDISVADMKKQLGLKKSANLVILDSLRFDM